MFTSLVHSETCRYDHSVRAGTKEPPSSTTAVDKVTARHYWGAADQGDVEAGEQEEADEGEDEGSCQDGWQPEERWRV